MHGTLRLVVSLDHMRLVKGSFNFQRNKWHKCMLKHVNYSGDINMALSKRKARVNMMDKFEYG